MKMNQSGIPIFRENQVVNIGQEHVPDISGVVQWSKWYTNAQQWKYCILTAKSGITMFRWESQLLKSNQMNSMVDVVDILLVI